MISSITSRKTQSDFQNTLGTKKNDNGNTSFLSTIFTKFFSLLFFKLEIIKLNPKIIQHTLRFSKKEKENPQAVIVSADTAVGRFFF